MLPNETGQDACALSSGQSANVLIVYFNGIDSKEILLHEADKRQMEVYLGSAFYFADVKVIVWLLTHALYPLVPGLPILDDAPWTVNPALLPAFYEWNRRVLTDYSVRHASHASLRGVYQILELSLSGTFHILLLCSLDICFFLSLSSPPPPKKVGPLMYSSMHVRFIYLMTCSVA